MDANEDIGRAGPQGQGSGGEQGHGDDNGRVTLVVIYNGQKKEISASLEETVQALFSQALHAFGSPPNPHTLALWTEGGAELGDPNQRLKDAGIKAGATLLLRPHLRGGQQ